MTAVEIEEGNEEEREEGKGARDGPTPFLFIAFGWSVFQLLVAGWWSLSADVVRAVHLAFALSLVFLTFPFRKKQARPPLLLALPLALVAAACALYSVFDRAGLAERIGAPLPRDILIGSLLLLFLFDAARRALGFALPAIGSVFILYALFSERMPGVLATAATPWRRIVETLSLGNTGIFGTPLDVSANTVFLFVLFGALLESAGGGKYFIDVAFSLLGGFRGGPAKASVLASGLTGMISGSSIANTVTTGTFTIPLMIRAGYPPVKAGAVEVAASTNGQLMPPIMGAAAFIIAETCNIPYSAVVRAAILPAFISYLALFYITHLEALKLNIRPLPRSELPPFRKTFFSGLHFLLPLAVLLYALLWERRSARLAALAGILCLMAVVLVRELLSDPRNALRRALPILGNGMVAGARNMMSIGVAVAAAGVVVGVLNLGLSSQVTEIIRLLSGGTLFGMLLITAVVSLILGMGLPTTANYIVMASLSARAIESLAGGFGLELPLIAIHLFVFYFGILSDDTPPVGLSAYAAAAISKADPIKTGIQGFLYDIRTALLPFVFLFNHRLLLIGVHGPLEILWVVVSATGGMFAFAAATQGWFLRRNRWWETLLLLAVTGILFRPGFMSRLLPIGDVAWTLLGFALYAAIGLRQHFCLTAATGSVNDASSSGI